MSCSRPAAMILCLGTIGAPVVNAQATAKSTIHLTAPATKSPAVKVLVVVNSEEITNADLQRALTAHYVTGATTTETRRRILEGLVDARLIRQFLASRKTVATREEVDLHLERLRQSAKRRGEEPEKVLSAAGFPSDFLRDELGLRLAWVKHADRTVTVDRLKSYFDAHRAEFDGTQVRASQVFRKVKVDSTEGDWQVAEVELQRLREKIESRKLSFADAAMQFSQAPTRDKGGDVGYFPYAGRMPDEFSRIAFQLKVGEMSHPFRTKFGVHLCLVTERRSGDLSLEDVRDEVLGRVSQELWNQTVAELRKSAKLEWKVEQP